MAVAAFGTAMIGILPWPAITTCAVIIAVGSTCGIAPFAILLVRHRSASRLTG
jgi:hypothetical protein